MPRVEEVTRLTSALILNVDRTTSWYYRINCSRKYDKYNSTGVGVLENLLSSSLIKTHESKKAKYHTGRDNHSQLPESEREE